MEPLLQNQTHIDFADTLTNLLPTSISPLKTADDEGNELIYIFICKEESFKLSGPN